MRPCISSSLLASTILLVAWSTGVAAAGGGVQRVRREAATSPLAVQSSEHEPQRRLKDNKLKKKKKSPLSSSASKSKGSSSKKLRKSKSGKKKNDSSKKIKSRKAKPPKKGGDDECPLQFLDFAKADPTKCGSSKRSDDNEKKIGERTIQPYCVGFRGNGDRVFAHFAIAARLVESLGPYGGQAGGSSGSLMAFFAEAIFANPHVTTCGDEKCCSMDEQNGRISFLLRSFEELANSFRSTLQDNALGSAAGFLAQVEAAGIITDLAGDTEEQQARGVENFKKLFETTGANDTPLLRAFSNPQIPEYLSMAANATSMALDIIAGARGIGSFNGGTDPVIFVRPSPLNWENTGEVFDIFASFLGGLAPVDGTKMDLMLRQCSTLNRDTWNTTQAIKIKDETGAATTCGEYYNSQLYAFINARTDDDPNMIDRHVGETISTSIHTSVITGKSYDEWEALRQAYIAANSHPPPFADVFTPDFDKDVFYGYFGAKRDFDQVVKVTGEDSKQAVFTDGKSDKFKYLGETSWRTVMQTSTAEPTASAGFVLDQDGHSVVSLGGWCDPVPSQVLAAMGCDRIILSNNPSPFGRFGLDVFRLHGGNDEQEIDIYGETNPQSGFNVAIDLSDATVCADVFGDNPDGYAGYAVEGLNAPLLTEDACLAALTDDGIDATFIRGCSAVTA